MCVPILGLTATQGGLFLGSLGLGLATGLSQRNAAIAAAVMKRANDKRPKREEISSRAGPWPGVGDAIWLAKKGRLLIKRRGNLGIGSQYSVLGTWSAEPEDPVETFFTPIPPS